MERASQEIWAKRVERWKDSGLSVAVYAREVGISPRSLMWWRWRLGAGVKKKRARGRRTTTTPASKTAMTLQSGSAATVSPLTFVEMTAGLGSDALEVVLLTSVRIRVRPDFDAPTLGRLLDVLEPRG